MNEAIFSLRMPKKTYFGIGAVEKIREAVQDLKASNVLIITDRGVINAGLVDTLMKELRSTCMHEMAEVLGGFYRISHGITNTLVLPHVMEFNLSANVEKFTKIAEFMGANVNGLDVNEVSKKSVSAVKELSRDIGLPQTLREVGVKREDIPALVERTFKWANESGNPREVSKKQLRALYEKAY